MTSNEVVIEKAMNPYQFDASNEIARYSPRIAAGVIFPPKLFHMKEMKDSKPSCE
jgi:hypothetical protein